MKSKLILLLACLVMVSVDVPAQSFGNKLKNKVLDKMNSKGDEKINQAIDSAVDKPVDKTEEKVKQSVKDSNKESPGSPESSQSGQPSEKEMQNWMEMMGGGAVTIDDYPDLDEIKPSDFKGSFDMDMESWKNGNKKDASTVSWYIREYDVAMIPDVEANGQKQESRIIFNRRKGIMTILTNDKGEKKGMVLKMKTITVDLSETEAGEDLDNVTVEVLKNVNKTIDGYQCYKVKAYDDEFESESWITEDLPIDMQKLFSFMSIQNRDNNPYEEKYGHIRGMVIESTSTDKKSGEIDILRMKNIRSGNPDGEMFSTDGYELIALPDGLGGFGGQ